MKKTTKKKIVVSAVSLFVSYLLAETIACLYEMINVYIPILQENYVTFEGMYTFCLIGCFLIAAFVIVLNLVIWFYDKIFKDWKRLSLHLMRQTEIWKHNKSKSRPAARRVFLMKNKGFSKTSDKSAKKRFSCNTNEREYVAMIVFLWKEREIISHQRRNSCKNQQKLK